MKTDLLKSLFLHVSLLALLLVSTEFFSGSSKPQRGKLNTDRDSPQAIEAVTVNEKDVMAEVARLQQQAQQQKEAVKAAELAKQEVAKLKLKQQKVEAQQKQALAALKSEADKEREALKSLQQKKDKQLKELAALDQKQQQAKAEQQKQRQAEQAREQQAALAARTQFLNSERQKYMALIKQKIDEAWIRPMDVREGLVCEVEIQVLPDGSVMNSKVIRSSGHFAFDRATEVAITRASPLPMPADKHLIEDFRHFKLYFRQPE